MSNRYFEDEKQTQLYQKYRMRAPKVFVERVINYLKEKYSGELELAVDVGCGSGQNTFVLADYFKRVIGTDVSPNQIANAEKVNESRNVTFEVCPAEKLNVPDGSVQLIAAMAAAHWFDLPKFYEEGRRVLSPGGVMAIYSYHFPKFSWTRNPSRNEALQKVYDEIASEGELTDFWAPCVKLHVLSYFRTITIPYDDLVRDESAFTIERQITLADLLGGVQTWSAFQTYKQTKGEDAAQAFISQIKTSILEVLEEDLTDEEKSSPDKIPIFETSPMILIMARKSS